MKVVGIIPARMGSSRFPGKPLVDILGMPMVIHVMKRAELCQDLSGVFVATDSAEIFDSVIGYGGNAIMTSAKHQSGTDRIAEACRKLDCDVVINIQGDEPLVDPKDLTQLIRCIKKERAVNFATLVCKSRQFGEITDCKAVLDKDNNIMYLSRADLPSSARAQVKFMYKHYCIVAFRKAWLLKFASWPQTFLEKIEYIEYLRILENGHKIKAVVMDDYTTSVDTPENLEFVLKMMKKDTIRSRYMK